MAGHLQNRYILIEMKRILGEDANGVDGQIFRPDDMGIARDTLSIVGPTFDFANNEDKIFEFNGRKFTSAQLICIRDIIKTIRMFDSFLTPPTFGFRLSSIDGLCYRIEIVDHPKVTFAGGFVEDEPLYIYSCRCMDPL